MFRSGRFMCVSSEGPHSSAGAEAAAMVVGASYERDLAPDPTPKDAQIRIRSGGPTRHVCEVSCLGVGSGPRCQMFCATAISRHRRGLGASTGVRALRARSVVIKFFDAKCHRGKNGAAYRPPPSGSGGDVSGPCSSELGE